MMIVRALTGRLDLLITKPSGSPDLNRPDKISFAAMVPVQVAGILEITGGRTQIEKIKTLIIGGSFLDQTLEKKLKTLENNIWQSYGMTETISHIALRHLNGPDASEWYKPLPGVELQKNKQGCLIITAPHIGVQNLVTNDLVVFNDEGLFKITGRMDNVVISGGIKLFPEEIEQKLSGMIEHEFFMAGFPDNKLGEKLVLLIEGSLKNQEQEKLLWETIKNRLAGYEVPKKIILVNAFVRSNNGKVMRKATLENYLADMT